MEKLFPAIAMVPDLEEREVFSVTVTVTDPLPVPLDVERLTHG